MAKRKVDTLEISPKDLGDLVDYYNLLEEEEDDVSSKDSIIEIVDRVLVENKLLEKKEE